ncbi:hypothetical protein L3X38_017764 [Prunus dulcis]|uniref:Uncharacterized protein n=1 Tax=Prunus dulcis TaxID=3755 RepID=A0AAD4W7X1_PRUDU|nr:hypothetical protein L3X38_017764 [Prunus dulcis]
MDDNDLGDIGSDPYEFANVIGDGDQPLYPGCSVLLWAINDFPAQKNLSGCVVKGYKACPICGDDTPSHSVGENDGDKVCWKKKSKFFDLEYWKYLPVRHALDVMHIEKNVCDSIIGTLLEIPGKIKDEIATQLDLLNMGVKTDLQPEYGERRTCLPPVPWNLSRAEKRAVCNYFYGMKIPEGYSSNIKNLVSLQNSRLLGLKSHDCHTLMPQLLLVAIRYVLEKPARYIRVLKGTVGVPTKQKMGLSRPLSSCTVSFVDRDMLNQAHLYVLENTEEVLPYIEEHMIHIKTTYPKFKKRIKLLQDKHNNFFIQWLRFKRNGKRLEDELPLEANEDYTKSRRRRLINGIFL